MSWHTFRLLTCVLFCCVAGLAAADPYPVNPNPPGVAPAAPPPVPMPPPGESAWPPPTGLPAPNAVPPEQQSVWPPETPLPSQQTAPGQYLNGPPPSSTTTIDPGPTFFPTPTYDAGPRWDFSVDALWLERSNGPGVWLGSTEWYNGPSNSQTVYPDYLASNDVLFALAPGLRLQLIAQITDRMGIEANCWGLQQWSIGRTIYADPTDWSLLAHSPWLQLSPVINGFDSSLSYTYKSEVANVELNQRFNLASYSPYRSAAFLWGVRYFYLSDDFALSGVDLTNAASETLDWKTKNNLIGMQVGIQCARTWDRFQLSTEAKAGLYANIYSQDAADSVTGSTGVQPYSLSHAGTDLAFLGEISILARYRVTDNVWIRGGYQFYYAAGLATGPRQLGGFDDSGDVGLDGLSLGVEYTR